MDERGYVAVTRLKKRSFLVDALASCRRLPINSIKVGEADVTTVSPAKNLGAWFDSHLDMSTHISNPCGSARYYLYSICHIRTFLE